MAALVAAALVSTVKNENLDKRHFPHGGLYGGWGVHRPAFPLYFGFRPPVSGYFGFRPPFIWGSGYFGW